MRNGVYIKEADVTGLEYTVSGLMENTEYGFVVQSWINGEYSVLSASDAVYLMSEQTYLRGDINLDGTVDSEDLEALRKVLSGEAAAEKRHDLNGDGNVDNRALSELWKILAGQK